MAINGYADEVSPFTQGLVTGGTFAAPSQWWFALYVTTPESDGTNLGTEFSAASYARSRIYGSNEAFLPQWSAPGIASTDFLVSNLQPVYMVTAQEEWGMLSGAVIMNSETGNLPANMVFGAAVDLPVLVVANMTVVFLQGEARLTTRNL